MKTWGALVLLVTVTTATAAPLSALGGKVCYEWIAPFFDFLTLNEGRDMKRSDLSRFFSYMDTDVDRVVSMVEFERPWQASTQMTQADTRKIFTAWAMMRENTHPTYITKPNEHGIWASWYPVKESDTVTRDSFTRAMERILKTLPNKGCPDMRHHFFE